MREWEIKIRYDKEIMEKKFVQQLCRLIVIFIIILIIIYYYI